MQPWRATLLLAAITNATPQQQRQHQPLQKVLLVLTVARRDRFYLTRRYDASDPNLTLPAAPSS